MSGNGGGTVVGSAVGSGGCIGTTGSCGVCPVSALILF